MYEPINDSNVVERKGLIVTIYRSQDYGRDTCSIFPEGVERVVVYGSGIPEIFSNKDYGLPAVSFKKAGNGLHAAPDAAAGKIAMFGGAYIATSDSRFSQAIERELGHPFYGAIALHDRVESQVMTMMD